MPGSTPQTPTRAMRAESRAAVRAMIAAGAGVSDPVAPASSRAPRSRAPRRRPPWLGPAQLAML
ncbi:hypothetical protein ACFULT_22860 [Rhodococcus sp. NPDC057297]|uniref:hypothetical protein n=1 Tax=Rhodococcus sp. NPDC057297 TaxID=3346090 RepID=UPI003642C968